MAAKRKPTPGEINELANQLEQDATNRNALYDRLDRLYYQKRQGEQDDRSDGVQIVTSPRATNTVDLVADLAAQQELTIQVPAEGESQGAQKLADDTESWLRAWLSLNERVQQQSFTGQMAWLAAQRARVILRTIFTSALVEKDKDGYRIASVPVLLQIRDPRYVYASDGINGLDCVVERWMRTAGEIRALYPDALDKDSTPDNIEIEWTEYWDKNYRCYFANGTPIQVKGGYVVPHGMGVVPYAIGNARMTPARIGVVAERPLLAAVETTVRNLDVWESILATAGWAAVTNSWIVKSSTFGSDGRALETGPGDVNYFAREDSIEPLQRAPLPGDFFQLGQILKEDYQSGTFPMALYGQGTEGMAGYAINLLSQSGRRVLLPIWSAIERCYESAFRNTVLICKNQVAPLVGDKVPLMIVSNLEGSALEKGRKIRRQLVLDTTKIDESFDVSVTLGDPMPQDDAQNLRLAIESTQAGLLSQQTALTKYKVVSDAQAEIQRVGIETMLKQLLGPELIKLAIERGYLPRNLELPDGFHVMPDGRIMPDSMMPQPEPQPEPEPEMMEQEEPNAADLQAMAGMPQTMPTMDEMSGAAPPMPGMAY